MIIEDVLLNYGVLGIWTITLLAQQYKQQTKTNKLIDNNTNALIRVYEVIHRCPYGK